MVRVTYVHGSARLSSTAQTTRTLLTNTRGEYVQLGVPNISNYDGLYLRGADGASYKTLWNLLPDGELREILVRERDIIRRFADAEQQFTLTENGLLARCTGKYTLTLDCKRLYDETEENRIYTLAHEHAHDAAAQRGTLARVSVLTVTYEKRDAYTLHLAIATTMQVSELGCWREIDYPYDAARATHATRWVYDALRLSGEGLVGIALHETQAGARRQALSLLINAKRTLARPAARGSLPLALAERSLAALTTDRGIIAGLPWFGQVWSRDELITLGALAHEQQRFIDTLDRWHSAVRDDGALPAIYPDEGLESSDAPGWLGVRTLQALGERTLAARLTKERLSSYERAQRTMLARIAARTRQGLVWNDAKTTWMDTDAGGGGRAGARIEIQALAIALCRSHMRLCERLGTTSEYAPLEQTLLRGVRERLVHDELLLDGLWDDGSADTIARPNLFLAWHACPDLFSREQWRGFFTHALTQLFLPWGGIASIATSAPSFHAHDTGERNDAYHAGDSWYFVNNLAALALHNVDGFSDKVEALTLASLRDLLCQGVLGHASEISSASVQEARGCHAQAWSASTLASVLRAVPPPKLLRPSR